MGQYYEFVGLLDHLNDRGLLDTGEYFVIGVDIGQYDPKDAQKYFKGRATMYYKWFLARIRSQIFLAFIVSYW